MEKQGGGHIVQITTALVDNADSRIRSVLTSLTKGGLDASTQPGNRICRARHPRERRGARHHQDSDAPKLHETLAALHAMGRMREIEEIAQAVLYLEDAKFVTGEILHTDGGQIAGH